MQQFFLLRPTCAFLALLFTLSADLKAASLLRYIFGSQPVSAEIQKISDVADKMTNFKTTVLKMNKLSKKTGLSSFNWFNTTWVDEEVVSAKSKHALLWQLIHEKYHTIGGHDWRRIVGACAVTTLLIRGLVTAYAKYDAGLDLGIVVPYSLPATFLALFLFLWHEEYCESQADAYADHVMQEGIVNA